MAMGPREGRVLHAMSIDDAYEVQRVLASSPGGRTEVVTIDGLGPYLRKKIPLSLVDRQVWAALAECESPRLPHVVATYETPDEFVAVCDFVPADTISEVVAAEKRLPAFEAVRITLEICEALENLHRHGIVHCDISPRNVLLAADGAHLIDLGIARARGTEPSSEGPLLGTHGFAAPEQYGFAPVDERSDVYAAARLLGFMLTGIEPGDDYRAALLDENVVPVPLRMVIKRGNAFEPSARYQTIGAFAEEVNWAASSGDGQAGFSQDTVSCQDEKGPGARINPEVPMAAPGKNGVNLPRGRRVPIPVWIASGLLLICVVAAALPGAVNDLIMAKLSYDSMSALSTQIAEMGDKSQNDLMQTPEEDESSAQMISGNTSEGMGQNSHSSGAAAGSDGIDEVLTIVESAWFVDQTGRLRWVFALHHGGSESAVLYPTVKIVGRDAKGNVVSSNSQVLSLIEPGQTIYFGSSSENGTAIQSVDFVPVNPSKDNLVQSRENAPKFRVGSISEYVDTSDSPHFAGEVFLEGVSDAECETNQLAITVVLRDSDGKMLGGETGFTNCPRQGESSAFDILARALPSSYASVEAYACEW